MSIPNLVDVVARLAAQYPEEWRQAHTGSAQTEYFVRRLAWVLHQQDARFGLNGKRGNPEDISDDVVCFDGVEVGPDGKRRGGDFDPTRGGVPVTVIDVIGGAGGPDPRPTWQHPLTPSAAAWVQPSPVAETHPQPGGGGQQPKPEPKPVPTVDLGPALAKLDAVLAEVVRMRGDFEAVKALATQAAAEAANAAGRASDLKDTLAKGADITGSVALSLRGGAALKDIRATYNVTNQG